MPPRTLGPWTLHAVETGFFWLDGGAMFGSVPKTLWSRTNPPDERNRIRLAMRCLLLEGEDRRILVDDGAGTKLSPKLADIYRIETGVPTLEDSLERLGLGVGDVTDVVLTHLHFDHAGGSTAREGERLVPRLPRARYFVQRSNWDNAHAPNPRERASYMPENFDALREAGVLTLWDGPQRPWPGVEVFTFEGHTRGQQGLRVHGPEGALYYVADLIPTASHVRVPFVMGYDMCAIESMDEKRSLLTRAASEGAWVLLEHDPVTAFARPRTEGDDFAWAERVPADTPAAGLDAPAGGGPAGPGA
jgi:glyoxylase-like metal-dependent hydrolase (beta-lactamase superfamily II)